jgi:hypothetical protein
MVWNSLKEILPDYVFDYCRLKVKRFDEEYGSDVAIWHSVDGLTKFTAFYTYVLSNTITRSSLKNERTIHSAQGEEKGPKDPSEKPKPVMQVTAENTGNESDNQPESEPPAKKQQTDQNLENKRKGLSKSRNTGQEKVCFLCKNAEHIWQNCRMHIDGRLEIFKREGLCPMCAEKNHESNKCTSETRCPTCEDPEDPTKGTDHRAICYIMHSFPTRRPGKPQRGKNDNGSGEWEDPQDQGFQDQQGGASGNSSKSFGLGGNKNDSNRIENSTGGQSPGQASSDVASQLQQLQQQLQLMQQTMSLTRGGEHFCLSKSRLEPPKCK